MIFIDASAIVAIMTREPEADELRERLEAADGAITSAIAVYEATLGVARKQSLSVPEARRFVSRFLAEAEVAHVPIGEREGSHALSASQRFGKGRHPARLNMGDCFAYACARTKGARLLFKGDDFGQTDIESA